MFYIGERLFLVFAWDLNMHAAPCKYHANTMQNHAKPCKTMQNHASTMQVQCICTCISLKSLHIPVFASCLHMQVHRACIPGYASTMHVLFKCTFQHEEGVRRESDGPPARPYPGAKRRAALAASRFSGEQVALKLHITHTY